MINRSLLVCLAAALTLPMAIAQNAAPPKKKVPLDLSKLPPAANKQNVIFETDIKPIFDKSCVRCHSAEKPKAKLRLDSLESTLKGGEDGKVVEPGNSTTSMLIHSIAQLGDPDTFMPPPKNKAGIPPLAKEQIGLIRAWIDQGAR